MKKKDEIKVCLVGSSGGHLTHLYMLKPFWKDKNRFWVTFDKEDARSLLEGEKVYPCYFPTNRSIKALIKNTKIAWDVLHAYLLHVTTTPSVAYIARVDDFDCGIMISASHNPYYDNGIKLIDCYGEKMPEETLLLVEDYIDGKLHVFDKDWPELPFAHREHIGCTVDYVAGRNRYMGYLISLGIYSFKGVKVGLDCANAGKVPSPAARKLQSGAKLSLHFRKSDEPLWSAKAVDRILHNEVYIGKLVQGKTRRLDYRSKKKMNVPMRDWVIVDNTHEAIIPAEQFELVRRILETETRRPNNAETVALFAGFRQTKAENEKELVVVQEELQQKKQIAGSTEVLLTADNLQQYVKKIEVDHKKNTYTEFVF